MFRLILILLSVLTGLSDSVDGYCMAQFKENMFNNPVSRAQIIEYQDTEGICKNLCLEAPLCITCDYEYETKKCRLYGTPGAYYLGNNERTTRMNAWVKYPSVSCPDVSLLDGVISSGERFSFNDNCKCSLSAIVQNDHTWRIKCDCL